MLLSLPLMLLVLLAAPMLREQQHSYEDLRVRGNKTANGRRWKQPLRPRIRSRVLSRGFLRAKMEHPGAVTITLRLRSQKLSLVTPQAPQNNSFPHLTKPESLFWTGADCLNKFIEQCTTQLCFPSSSIETKIDLSQNQTNSSKTIQTIQQWQMMDNAVLLGKS